MKSGNPDAERRRGFLLLGAVDVIVDRLLCFQGSWEAREFILSQGKFSQMPKNEFEELMKDLNKELERVRKKYDQTFDRVEALEKLCKPVSKDPLCKDLTKAVRDIRKFRIKVPKSITTIEQAIETGKKLGEAAIRLDKDIQKKMLFVTQTCEQIQDEFTQGMCIYKERERAKNWEKLRAPGAIFLRTFGKEFPLACKKVKWCREEVFEYDKIIKRKINRIRKKYKITPRDEKNPKLVLP